MDTGGTRPLLPWALWPGAKAWADQLDALAARPEPLWIQGPPGSGVSTLATQLAAARRTEVLEEAQAAEALAWLRSHPRGVCAARGPAPEGSAVLELRLASLEEHPEAIPGLLEALSAEAGAPLPEALGALPCPGNLRELRTRVVRWQLLGQLPERRPTEAPTFEAEDLATNLHALEAYLLHRALRRSYGNRVEAARRLAVSRRHLYLLIDRHGDPVRGEPGEGLPPKRLLRVQNASRTKGPR
ncbi:MAG TPA: helix-turn-helix domain-containing protein [Holophagaceae bacterium]|nr:helix-turn-helix domain-containing protein [Holophagaceae bacterium]